ncbi:hypothetical protein FB451DRAFT_1166818 [Mycena latifolia]|nr:hypothetical protein FB451DRAFT_1166818 [Mycena latifolia]
MHARIPSFLLASFLLCAQLIAAAPASGEPVDQVVLSVPTPGERAPACGCPPKLAPRLVLITVTLITQDTFGFTGPGGTISQSVAPGMVATLGLLMRTAAYDGLGLGLGAAIRI